MPILAIHTYPSEVLARKAEPVKETEIALLQQLIDDMIETMYDAPGIGLAAPQVGVSKQIIVVDVSGKFPQYPLTVLINPKIIHTEGVIESEEGCLSLPGYTTTVKRAEKLKVQGLDREGKEVIIEADGLFARALQHEIDHLDGKLLLDRISSIKREFYKKRLLKKMAKSKS